MLTVAVIAEAGTTPVVSGSMGEAVHLVFDLIGTNILLLTEIQDSQERQVLIRAAREALHGAGLDKTPIVAGVGVASTRESIRLSKEAASAGADFVMVIPPGYYAGALMANKESVRNFFVDVAEASPLPV